jgi:tetratricopeptide (TPR) repeat protein
LLYAAEGRNVEALEAIERAAKESILPFDMYLTLGKLQIALNHPEQALAAFAGAEKHSPYRNGGESLAPELYAEIAEGNSEAQRLLGHWTEAIAFQQEATRRTPLVVSRWNRLAALYEATGQTQLAAEARQRGAGLQVPDAPR